MSQPEWEACERELRDLRQRVARLEAHAGLNTVAPAPVLADNSPALADNPPALADGVHDFRSIRAAEKILSVGEDWRDLGTDDDPMVRRSRGEAEVEA